MGSLAVLYICMALGLAIVAAQIVIDNRPSADD